MNECTRAELHYEEQFLNTYDVVLLIKTNRRDKPLYCVVLMVGLVL